MENNMNNKLFCFGIIAFYVVGCFGSFSTMKKVSFFCSTQTNDTFFNSQWHVEKVGLNKAWDIYTGSNNISVGVIDSGICGYHPDLSNNINSSISMHFNDGHCTLNPLEDGENHGSHVAGIIGAEGNNNLGVAGACWDIDLVSLSVAVYSSGLFYVPGIVSAINYASNPNTYIPVLNASLGMPEMKFLDYNYDYLDFAGSFADAMDDYDGLLVCAAGNSTNYYNCNCGQNIGNLNYLIYPASCSVSNMIVVGNSDANDDMAITSNYGSTKVHLFAPGENIYSTSAIEQDNPTYYKYESGTSMASPLVAGTAALLKSIDPSLTSAQIKSAILDNVDVISGLSGLCTTGGRLNAYQAALSILPSIVANDTGVTFNSNINYQRFLKMNLVSGHYTLSINNSVPCRVTIYQRYIDTPFIQQSFTTSGTQTISFLSETNQMVYIRVENLGNNNGDISISAIFQNHSYNNSYAYQNPLFHRAYCNCGDYVLLPHIVYRENEWATYGTCAICSSIVPIGGGIILSRDNPDINNSSSIFDLLDEPVIQCF